MLREPGCLSRRPGFVFKGYKPKTAVYGYEYPAVRRSGHGEARRPIRILPKPSLIPESAKTADMICISSKGICGGNDFSRARLKEGRLSAGKAGIHQAEKSLYRRDMKGFWLRDKCRIIAVITPLSQLGQPTA